MRIASLLIVLFLCGSVSAQSKKDEYRAKRLAEKQAQAKQQAEIAKLQQEYTLYVRAGVLPKDKDRAALLLKHHELMLKQAEIQAKNAPKGKWVLAQDPRTGRFFNYFEEEGKSNSAKLPTSVTGTLRDRKGNTIDVNLDAR